MARWLVDHSLLEFTSLLLLAAVLGQIIVDYIRDPILIDPIAVPKVFEEQGYTPQVFSNEIRDEIDEIKRAATTYGKKEGLAAQNNRSFATVNKDIFANKESFAVANSEALSDIEIPETKLSFRTVVDFLEDLSKFRPRHISGEVTILGDAPNPGPAGSHSHEQMSITIRVTRMDKGDPRLLRMSASSAVDPRDAINKSAKAVLQLIDPYVMAAYEYEVEKNQHAAWFSTTQCYGDLAKWGWLLQGIILEDQHDLNGAIDKYRKSMSADPEWAYPHNELANALSEKGNYDGAIAEYQRAVKLNPKHIEFYFGLGNALFMKQDYDGMIAGYWQAVKVDPTNARSYIGWGYAMFMKKDYDGAIVQYQQAVRVDPTNAFFYDIFGDALAVKKDYDGAIVQYRQAVKVDPTHAFFYDDWGKALAAKKDYDGAIIQYRQAVKVDPTHAWAYDDWGNALAAKKDYDGAIVQYRQAVSLDPTNETFRADLEAAREADRQASREDFSTTY